MDDELLIKFAWHNCRMRWLEEMKFAWMLILRLSSVQHYLSADQCYQILFHHYNTSTSTSFQLKQIKRGPLCSAHGFMNYHSAGELHIIVEFCGKGSLLHYLRSKRGDREDPLTPKSLIAMAHQVSQGMKYLASKKVNT